MLRGTRELRKYICSFVRFDPKPDLDNANVGMSEKICKKIADKKAGSVQKRHCLLFVSRGTLSEHTKKIQKQFRKIVGKSF